MNRAFRANPAPWPPSEPRRILIVAPAWVGDMVMAQSLFILLKSRFPDCQLTVLAPRQTISLTARMPEVDEAFELPFRHGELKLWQRYRFARRLRECRFDWCIVLPNSFKSALIPFWANIPLRTGFKGELRHCLLNDVRPRSRLPLHVQRCNYLALGRLADDVPLPYPSLRVDPQALGAALQQEQLATDKPILALCPGAEFGPSKRWPLANYAHVGRMKAAEGWTVWVFGGANDRAMAETLCTQIGPASINLAGRTSLEQVVDLLSRTHTVLTNDSGLMHIAAAVGCRLVAVFGSTTPSNTPPLTDKAVMLAVGLHCRPCYARVCRYGHYQCLNDVSVEDVLHAINGSLSGDKTVTDFRSTESRSS